MDPHMQKILEDIFELDPTLKSQEKQIMGIIEKMTEIKPDSKFDKHFQSELHDRIRTELRAQQTKKSLREHVSGVISYLKFSHRLSLATALGIVLLFGIGGFWMYSDWNGVPTVVGANVSLEYRKVPYNVKSLDVIFSTPLSADTVNAKNVTLAPYVEGTVSLINEKTVRYTLVKPLTIDENYILTISKNVHSSHDVALADDFVYNFRAIGGAKATKVLPSGDAENLSQNIVVLFNIPVVPMATLANRDLLPCPLTITPHLDGTCRWTSPTILEFIPRVSLAGATEYHVKVADIPGLLYKLSESLEASFKTPALDFTIGTPDEIYDATLGENMISSSGATFRPSE